MLPIGLAPAECHGLFVKTAGASVAEAPALPSHRPGRPGGLTPLTEGPSLAQLAVPEIGLRSAGRKGNRLVRPLRAVVGGRAGHLREVDDAPDAAGRDVAVAVPQPAAVPT